MSVLIVSFALALSGGYFTPRAYDDVSFIQTKGVLCHHLEASKCNFKPFRGGLSITHRFLLLYYYTVHKQLTPNEGQSELLPYGEIIFEQTFILVGR